MKFRHTREPSGFFVSPSQKPMDEVINPVNSQQTNYAQRIESLANAATLVFRALYNESIENLENIKKEFQDFVVSKSEDKKLLAEGDSKKINRKLLESFVKEKKTQKKLENLSNYLPILQEEILLEQLKTYFQELIKKGKDGSALLLSYLHYIEYKIIKKFSNSPQEVSLERWLTKAEPYTNLSKPRPILKTNTPIKDGLYLEQIEIPQSSFSETILDEFLLAHPKNLEHPNCPIWYKNMEEYERILFDISLKGNTYSYTDLQENRLTKKDSLRQKLHTIPSILRTIPGLPNFMVHRSVLKDAKGNRVDSFHFDEHYRSSISASRDLLEYKHMDEKDLEELRLKFTVQNIQHLLQTFIDRRKLSVERFLKLPLLMGSLISDVPLLDRELYNDKSKAIQYIKERGIALNFWDKGEKNKAESCVKLPNLLNTNHALNAARHLKGTNDCKKTQDSIQKLIDIINESIRNNHRNKVHLEKIVEELKFYTKSSTEYSLFDNNRELHIASLEEFACLLLGGLVHYTCISGKDRKGIQTIYVDAMKTYYYLYGKFPPLHKNAPDRKSFVELFVKIYLSRHQEEAAALNAPGCRGLKNMENYCPEDIIEAIKEKSQDEMILKNSHNLAGSNDFGKLLIAKPNSIVSHFITRGFFLGIGVGQLIIAGVILTLVILSFTAVIPMLSMSMLMTLGLVGVANLICAAIGGAIKGAQDGLTAEASFIKEIVKEAEKIPLLPTKNDAVRIEDTEEESASDEYPIFFKIN